MTKKELQLCQELLEVNSLTSLPLKIAYAKKYNIQLGTKDNLLDEVHKHMLNVHMKFKSMVNQQVAVKKIK